MEYTPEAFGSLPITEHSRGRPLELHQLTCVFTGYTVVDSQLLLEIDGLDLPLKILNTWLMTFGSEKVTALQYLERVIEEKDLIDVVVSPATGDCYPMKAFWIHIRYAGAPEVGQAFKEDGLFAMRAKAGEKAERSVAVGTPVTWRPPHRSVLAALLHTAPAKGIDVKPLARKRVDYPTWR